MQGLQMVDLKRQYLKIKDEVLSGIQNVIENTAFINGPQVKEFSTALAQYLDVKYVIPCANGTDALQIALMALNVKPGDEVIAPSFTYIATVEVIALLGLKPVFVDVDADTFTIDPKEVEAAITDKTKAIIPVHLYGQSAPMEELLAISSKYNIPIIEDNAQAIGGHYTFSDGTKKKTGTMGLIGCTSFFPSKNLGCYGDGGAMFTNDDDIAQKLQMIANHGQIKKYYHEIVGVNSRLDTIQAVVLNAKLKHLDEYCDARRKAADFYDNAFSGNEHITTPKRVDFSHHVFHQYTIKLSDKIDRDLLVQQLSEKNIPSMVYYPVPSHKQNMVKQWDVAQINLPITDALNKCVISLPIHTELSEEELEYITSNFIQLVNLQASK